MAKCMPRSSNLFATSFAFQLSMLERKRSNNRDPVSVFVFLQYVVTLLLPMWPTRSMIDSTVPYLIVRRSSIMFSWNISNCKVNGKSPDGASRPPQKPHINLSRKFRSSTTTQVEMSLSMTPSFLSPFNHPLLLLPNTTTYCQKQDIPESFCSLPTYGSVLWTMRPRFVVVQLGNEVTESLAQHKFYEEPSFAFIISRC